MNLLQHVPAGIALLLAGSVTAGSVYVTVGAAIDSGSQPGSQQPAVQPTGTSVPAPAVPISSAPSTNTIVAEASELSAELTSFASSPGLNTIILKSGGTVAGRLGQVTGDGQLHSAAEMDVRILRQGRIVAQVTTDEQGVFTARGLTPGVYAVVAAGENGYVAYSFAAIPGIPDESPVGASDEPQLLTAVVQPENFLMVRRLIIDRLRTTSGLSASTDANTAPLPDGDRSASDIATTIQHHQVLLAENGRLGGLVTLINPVTGSSYAVTDLTVYFVHNGEEVANSDVNADGTFDVSNLVPGRYSVVAAGQDGVLAFGADIQETTDGFASLSDSRNQFIPVSVKQSVSISGSPVSPQNFSASGGLSTDNPDDELVADAACCGAPAGAGGGFGGGGGGGGIGGGGGLGTILGAAGLATGIAALVDDGDSRPASP